MTAGEIFGCFVSSNPSSPARGCTARTAVVATPCAGCAGGAFASGLWVVASLLYKRHDKGGTLMRLRVIVLLTVACALTSIGSITAAAQASKAKGRSHHTLRKVRERAPTRQKAEAGSLDTLRAEERQAAQAEGGDPVLRQDRWIGRSDRRPRRQVRQIRMGTRPLLPGCRCKWEDQVQRRSDAGNNSRRTDGGARRRTVHRRRTDTQPLLRRRQL